MKYMIHTMPKRLWYVNDYLIPSMIKQGIYKDDIMVYNDSKQEGNLKACMKSWLQLKDMKDGTWHLQDDVIISSKFKEVTEQYKTGFVCGFYSEYDGNKPDGRVSINDMWFSFPCIRIPNVIAKGCAKWVLEKMIGNPIYKEYWKKGVNDDWFFRRYVLDNYKDAYAINLNPNIVDHIDYLIGGTVNSSKRGKIIRSKLWEEENLIDKLAENLEVI